MNFKNIRSVLSCVMFWMILFSPEILAQTSATDKKTPPVGECYTRQDLSARAAGFISKVYVTDGQLVKKGDILAELDHRLLKTAVKEASAGVSAAKAQLSLAQDALNRLKQMKSSASPQEIFSSEVKVAQASAQLAQAKAALERTTIQLNDTFIKAEIEGHVSGLPRVKGLYVQAGNSLGRIEATTSSCAARR